MAEWLSSHAPLWQPRVCQFGSWAWTWHGSSGHVEAAFNIAQQEGLTTGINNYVLEDFGENKKRKKKKDW